MHLKRLIPLIMLLLLLAGCEIKQNTPEAPTGFNHKAVVCSGDFSFDCEICKNEDTVKVTVLSTSASGMVMTYDGEEISFSYDDYRQTLPTSAVPKSNTAIVIYEVLGYISDSETALSTKIDGGYQYKGRISAGEFTFVLRDDNSPYKITVPTADLVIEFI